MFSKGILLGVLLSIVSVECSLAAEPVVIGSKKFTESYVLGEIAKRALENAAVPVEFRPGMGGTIILWEALRTGQIGAYPDYTGTIAEEILRTPGQNSIDAIRRELQKFGVGVTNELGFNNSWALAMQRSVAERLKIRTISQLRDHPELKFGLTHEFLGRQDGWQPLAKKYQLTATAIGLDHGLGYAALQNGSIQVKDAYSTDAKIGEYNLAVLEDDLHFFPQYKAVFLYQLGLSKDAVTTLKKLEGTMSEDQMVRLNASAEQTKNYARAADLYFNPKSTPVQILEDESLPHKLTRWTLRHLELAGVALLLSVLVGVPLGIAASRNGVVGQAILSITGAIQTIPSLALLALLVPIPFFGISARTAIAALFLYGLLPIVRNTATGLQDIAQPIRESAVVLGLRPVTRFWKIYLPIASRTILAGIKTSAVINIGTATLAALIGAGGLGEPIVSGLNLNDHATILQGAVPAAVLALLVQWSFELLDRLLIPKGLRL